MSRFELACIALRGALDAYEEALVAYRESKSAPPEERKALADCIELCIDAMRVRSRAVDEAREQAKHLWEVRP